MPQVQLLFKIADVPTPDNDVNMEEPEGSKVRRSVDVTHKGNHVLRVHEYRMDGELARLFMQAML